jgi:8-oxo-dGTP pyrophosphatase MutT (NUDIX family)
MAPEVFMLRRHSRAVFASHHVFPGGVLEASDSNSGVQDLMRGRSDEAANELLGMDSGSLGYFSAAIRETFEESGVLLAKDGDGRWAFDGEPDAHESYREALNNGSLSWADFLSDLDLYPALDHLHYIAYWVTPPARTKRFSTRFFLAVIPDGQHAVHDDAELVDSCWMTAADAIEAGRRGDIQLMYPTYATLRDIGACETVADIVAWARLRGESGEARLLPAFVEVDGKDTVVMPGDPLYPEVFDT